MVIQELIDSMEQAIIDLKQLKEQGHHEIMIFSSLYNGDYLSLSVDTKEWGRPTIYL